MQRATLTTTPTLGRVGDGYVTNGTAPADRYIGYIRPTFEPAVPATLEPLSEADAKLIADGPRLLAELKRMYEREDALVSAIKELCDSEDSTGCSGDLTVVRLDPMLKLYELTSE